MKMFTVLGPLFEKFKDGSPLQLLVEGPSVVPRKVPIFPDLMKYEVKEYEVDASMTVELPWRALLLGSPNPNKIIALVPMEEGEES